MAISVIFSYFGLPPVVSISTIAYNSNINIYHSILDDAIDQLPPQQQLVYLLSRHERLRYAEVANRLNISRESVKKYLQIKSWEGYHAGFSL